MCCLVTSIFLYACESWTLTAELPSRIQAMEMRCYRKILHISYKDHVTNEKVRAKEEEDKADRQKEVGRQHQEMDRPGVRQVPEAVENRGKWRKLVAKSSVVPQRPARLRD